MYLTPVRSGSLSLRPRAPAVARRSRSSQWSPASRALTCISPREGARFGQAIRETSRVVMAPVLLLEIRAGGLSQKRYGSAAVQLMSTATFAPLAFGISIGTPGHVLKTRELRGRSTIRMISRDNVKCLPRSTHARYREALSR